MSLTYFVALAEVQAARVMEQKELSAVAISPSGTLPLWTRRELALESFFRECNRRGVAALMPGNMDALVPVTSGTGGYDPVPRNHLCGRTYRFIDEHQMGTDGETIAALLEVRIPVKDFEQWQEMKLLTHVRGERMELHGTLPLPDTTYDMKRVLYSGMDFRTCTDVCVAPEYYFRCNGRCSRSTCSVYDFSTWHAVFVIIVLLTCALVFT